MPYYYDALGNPILESQTPSGHFISRPAHSGPEAFSVPDDTGWEVGDTDGPGDTITGGAGDDTYDLANNSQVVVEADTGGTDTVKIFASYILPANIENLIVVNNSGDPPLYGVGNAKANLIVAGLGMNSSVGLGDVQVAGLGGDDVLVDNAHINQSVTFIENLGDGNDVIYNFKATSNVNADTSGATVHDVIRLQGWGYTSFAQVQQHMSPQTGPDGHTDTAIAAPDGVQKIIVRDHAPTDFTAKDFGLTLNWQSQVNATPTFDDEFNSLSLRDPWVSAGTAHHDGNWRPDLGNQGNQFVGDYSLPSNHELQDYISPYYRSYYLSQPSAWSETPFTMGSVDGATGTITITAQAADTAHAPAGAFSLADEQFPGNPATNFNFTSGLLSTKPSQDGSGGFSQQYGYFEMRAELPTGSGVWPAFWLLPIHSQGAAEIDIMEQFVDKQAFGGTVHNSDGGPPPSNSNIFTGPTTGWHTYGLLWKPDVMVWTFDGTEVFETATPSAMKQADSPFYILANLALGDHAGPLDTSALPAKMNIDYIRAYSLSGGSPPPPPSGQTYTGHGNEALVGGAGDDTFLACQQGGESLSGYGGADDFVFPTSAPWATDDITDFAHGVDKIDLSALFNALHYAGSDPIAEGYIKQYDNAHGGTWLYVDTDGFNSGDTSGVYITNLEHVTAGSLTRGDFIIGSGSPPPPPPPPPPPAGQTFTGHGNEVMTGGPGDDLFFASQQGGETMTGNGGADHFVFPSSAPWATDDVTDFTHGVDKLDLYAIFQALHYTGSDPLADGYIKQYDNGHGGTWLYVDTDGYGSADTSGVYITNLEHVTAGTLTRNDFII